MIRTDAWLLGPEDLNGPAWGKIKMFLETNRDALRARNDDPKNTADQTAVIRGHIACINSILALAQERTTPKITSSGAVSWPPRATSGRTAP